jgi:hypothetical protein
MTGTSIYVHSYIVYFKCFLLVGVCYIIYRGFFKQKSIKLVAVITYARLERIVGSLQKLSQFNTTEVSVLCTETVNSFFHLYECGIPSQPYRWCSFGYRYSNRSWRSCSNVIGMLWLKLATTVVIAGPQSVHCFIGLVCGLWRLCHLFFVSHSCYVNIMLIRLKQIDVKWLLL